MTTKQLLTALESNKAKGYEMTEKDLKRLDELYWSAKESNFFKRFYKIIPLVKQGKVGYNSSEFDDLIHESNSLCNEALSGIISRELRQIEHILNIEKHGNDNDI